MLTTDEKMQILAKAILELAEKAAREWDYDGEQSVSTGVDLTDEGLLREITGGKDNG